MTDSRQYPLVVMTVAEEATLARFGIQERFEAGTRTMFGHERKIVTDHVLGRFALFVDATDTERIAEALNGGVTSVYVWRDDLAGAVVGTEPPSVGSPRDFDCCSGTGGHPNAHTGAQDVSAVERDLIREARELPRADPGDVIDSLVERLADAFEASVARTAELEARIETTRLAATRLNGPQVSA